MATVGIAVDNDRLQVEFMYDHNNLWPKLLAVGTEYPSWEKEIRVLLFGVDRVPLFGVEYSSSE